MPRAGAATPKVSVLLVTYNQERFIAQALDSALAQRADFRWEIVVGEDCSTDGTRQVIVEYARRHPDRIRTLLHPHRLGPHARGMHGKNNFVTTYRACRGEYVALLEGDDYWTDERKLAKQVAFLDRHLDCAICCHPVAVEYSDERARHWPSVIGVSAKEICTIEDILRLESKPEMPTPSVMIRRGLLLDFPDWFYEVFNGDYAIHLLLADRGHIGFLRECMAVHRKHADGASRLYETDPEFCNDMLLKLHRAVDRHFDYRYHAILRPYIVQERRRARAGLRAGRRRPARGAGAPRFDVVAALRNQAALVSQRGPRLSELRRAVDHPAVSWTEWLLLFAAALDYRPDLIVELGRARGNSTCALTEAASVLGDCRVRSYGYDTEHAYETLTTPRLRRIVPADWFDRQEIVHKDVTQESAADMLGGARRVLLFWDAHGETLAAHVLGRILPGLAAREHLVMVHDIHDARHEAVDSDYVTADGRLNRWQADFVSPYEELLPIYDFLSRNRIRLDTPARAASRRYAAAATDVLSVAVRDIVGPTLDLFPSDSTMVALAYFSCHDRASSRPLAFPPANAWALGHTSLLLDPGTSTGLSLDEFAPSFGTVEPTAEGGVQIVTPPREWAYAARLAIPAEARAGHGAAAGHVRIRARVTDGPVGFGVVSEDGTSFLDRRFLTPSPEVVEVFLRIPRMAQAGDLIVQTWDRAASGTALVEGIDLLLIHAPSP